MSYEELLQDTDEIEIEKKIESLESDYDKMNLILEITLPDLRWKMIDKISNEYCRAFVIKSLPDNMIVKLMKNKEIKDFNFIDYLEQDKRLDFVKNNLETILEWMGVDGDVKSKAQDLQSVFLTNENFFVDGLYHNSKLLNDKYYNIFSIDKISHISNYIVEQNKIYKMSDKELQVFSRCIRDFEEKCNSPLEWTSIAQSILNNMEEYSALIENLNLEQIDFEKLSAIIQNPNIYKIQTETDYENIEKKIIQQCDNDIKSNDIDTKKNALIRRAFGYDIEFAKSLLRKFGGDLENLPESIQKDELKIIKNILEETKEQNLEELYSDYEKSELKIANKAIITRNYQNEYFKMYQDIGFDIKDGKEVAENVYEAGTDFSFLITATSLLRGQKSYKDSMNIPKNEVQHFCCSYIRNDMLGYFSGKEIIYAFNPDPSIMIGAGPNSGLNSNRAPRFSLEVDEEQEKYYSPDTMINNTKAHNVENTTGFNEIDMKVNKNGEHIPCICLIVFREKGKIINGDYALKAQNDWKSEQMPDGLPIIIIDKDECKISEMEKLTDLINKYKENANDEIAKKIYYNIRNNLQSDENYLSGTDLTLENVPQMEDNKIGFSIHEFANNVLRNEKIISELLEKRKIEYNNTEKQVIGKSLKKENNIKENPEEQEEKQVKGKSLKKEENTKETPKEQEEEIDLDEIMRDINKDELAENYNLTTPEDRKSIFEMLKGIWKEMKNKILTKIKKEKGEESNGKDR